MKNQLSVRLSVLIAAIFAVFLLIGGAAEADEPGLPPTEYVVESGDTLWSIAGLYAPADSDIRATIHDIRVLSGLETSVIHPGQKLLIPQG
ncbi:MAG: LysM peptidoglycan-binding domain-containing protein [Acidimicrobiia bacterium]|nr:LysM peptidoglycan-binding domain-containing protein [Acidimicrobiia bacterium]